MLLWAHPLVPLPLLLHTYNQQEQEASCGIRIHDLPLTERVLYQLSYRGHECKEEEHKSKLSSPPIEHLGRTAWKNARFLPGVSEEAHVWVRREDQLALDKRSSRSD